MAEIVIHQRRIAYPAIDGFFGRYSPLTNAFRCSAMSELEAGNPNCVPSRDGCMTGNAVIDRCGGGVGESYKSPFQRAVEVGNPCGQRLEPDDVRASGDSRESASTGSHRRSHLSPRVWNINLRPDKEAKSLMRLSRGYYQTPEGSQRRRVRHSDLCCCRGPDGCAKSRGLCRRFRGPADWTRYRKLPTPPMHWVSRDPFVAPAVLAGFRCVFQVS